MARAYVKIYLNGHVVRVFGGNKADVRAMKKWYDCMSKEQFLAVHPRFSEVCAEPFDLQTVIRIKR